MKRTKLLRKTPLKKMSKEKAKATRAYWPLRRKFLAEHRWCEVPTQIHECGFWASSIHHSKGQHWKIMNDTRWWIATCVAGHAWIEANKKEARKMGLIKYK